MRIPAAVAAAASLVLASAPALAQAPQATPSSPDYPRGRISGYLFADAYENLAGDPRHAYSASGADSGQAFIDGSRVITRDLNGLQLRRVYFQLDNDLSAKYATRFRLEADSRSLTSDGRIGVAVKAAYMLVRNLYPRADLYFGVVTTPAFEGAEDFWQYRAIEKTIADFRGLAPSADAGVLLKGFVDANHAIGYSAIVANGAGNKPETNRQKRAGLAVPLRWRTLRLEPYADYENGYGGQDRATYKLFAGWELWKGAIGWEVVDQVQHRPAAPSREPRGHSFFARVAPRADLAAFARVDLWQPDRNAAGRVDQQLWIAGVDWQPAKDVHVMPSVEALQYASKGGAAVPPHHDVQARVTLYYRFSRPQS